MLHNEEILFSEKSEESFHNFSH